MQRNSGDERKMNSIIINGITISTNGSSINISNGKIIVDGNEIHVGDSHNVTITGDIKNLSVTGSVVCNDVSGDVDAGGSVTANNIKGDIDAGGSVHIRK